MRSHIVLVLTVFLFSSVCQSQPVAPITTSSGIVESSVTNDIIQWINIPYAVSPAGKNRFKPPQAQPFVNKVVNTRSMLPICPQKRHDWMSDRFEMTEDCLVLNIWAPRNASALPVVVFIHGGSFNSGMGILYNGSTLVAAEKIVVVTINYRLSVFGFLSLSQLVSESKLDGGKGEGVGMFGLLDQQLALQWVKNNIALFGGAADKVTIYGESAGAASVVAQLAIPSSKGLFRAAVISSTYAGPFYVASFSQQQLWNQVVTAANCTFDDYKDVLTCLRNMSFDKLNEVTLLKDSTGITPVTPDGVFLTDLPYTLLQKRIWNNVPVLIGSNSHEMSTILQQNNQADCSNYDNAESLAQVVNKVDASKAKAIMAVYPLDTKIPTPYYDNILEILGDQTFRCVASHLSDYLQSPGVTTFMYSWEVFPSWIAPSCLRDGHATELPYMFTTLLTSRSWSFLSSNSTSFTPQEAKASALFQKILGNFATTLDPSFTWDNVPFKWPQFNALQSPFVKIALGDTLYSANTKFRDGKCKYWDMGQFVDVAAQKWSDVLHGDFINPKLFNSSVTGWSRGPCPGLNTLANHGFLHRDGNMLTRDVVVWAIWNVFHVDMGVIFDALVIGPGKTGGKFGKIDPATNLTFFNLGDLAQHDPFVCEHDASLSRVDAKFGNQNEFDQAYFDQFLALAENGLITYTSIAKARVLRIDQCRKYNSNCVITEPQQRPGVVEGILVVRAFSGGVDNSTVANVKSFFVDEKLPADFIWALKETTASEVFGPLSTKVLQSMATLIGTIPIQPIPGQPDQGAGEDTNDTYSKSVVVGLAVALAIVGLIAIVAVIFVITKSGSSSSPERVF